MNIDYLQAFEIIPRSLISLLVLFIVTSIMGKKQVSQLSLFDYVMGISIGNFAAEITLNFETQYINGVIAVIVFGLVAYFVSLITMKSILLRRILIGVPTIIIQNGKILEKSLKKLKIDINDLMEQTRAEGYFDISELEYVLMEANGKLSILPKAQYKPLTPSDMKIKVKKSSLCSNVIIDGKIMVDNLKNSNITQNWLKKQISSRGYKIDQILLATVDDENKISIYKKNVNQKSSDVLE
ncbi:MAG: DUF421 domain-containing protein [Bacilli bacterium]|nr:DUF421 domain-containing protein [Bacilli bacterium]